MIISVFLIITNDVYYYHPLSLDSRV